VMAYRERFSNRAENARMRTQSGVNAAEAKETATDESKLNKPEGNQLLNDGQPDSNRQDSGRPGVSNAVRYSRGARLSSRASADGANLSAGQPRRNILRSKRPARKVSGSRGRLWTRYAYKRH
ncbi:MAG TPA: hypothetical protein VNI02_04070, partial [Blastocatellia bacterium]|nr:hypothetical protein [Blastocatellia bacterium]